MAESRTLPDTPIRRAAATIGEEGISKCAGERALLAHSRERRKRQPALSSKELTRLTGGGMKNQDPGTHNREPQNPGPGTYTLTTKEQYFRKSQRI